MALFCIRSTFNSSRTETHTKKKTKINPTNRNWNDSHSSQPKILNKWMGGRKIKRKYYVANSAKCYVLIITYGRRSQPSLPSHWTNTSCDAIVEHFNEIQHQIHCDCCRRNAKLVLYCSSSSRYWNAPTGEKPLCTKTTKKTEICNRNISWLIVIWYMSHKDCNLYSNKE